MSHCKLGYADKYIRGLIAHTMSETKGKKVHVIQSNTNVWHYVEIKNLKVYPMNIVCEGRIVSKPHLIVFKSQNSNVDDKHWIVERYSIEKGQKCIINHVQLVPRGSGNENILTIIKACWPQGNASVRKDLSFSVEARA